MSKAQKKFFLELKALLESHAVTLSGTTFCFTREGCQHFKLMRHELCVINHKLRTVNFSVTRDTRYKFGRWDE